MTKINYITNLPVSEYSGGWSGMNHNVYLQLCKYHQVNLVEKINPSYFAIDIWTSRLWRAVKMKGLFPAFTRRRLKRIAALIDPKLDSSATLNFFHGSTSWLNVKSQLPYALYADACFATYMDVYHDASRFSEKQLDELYEREGSFLSKASAVFFSSQWALNDAKNIYNLQGENFFVAGLGGGFPGLFTSKERQPYFLFIGLDFLGKGGDLVVNSFLEFKKSIPGYKLKIVGAKPPAHFLIDADIEYVGLLNKSIPSQFQALVQLFSEAYAFLLPSSRDLTPLVLIEAGSVGCPVIASANFGIPEIIRNGETGVLIESGHDAQRQMVAAMTLLHKDKLLHQNMSTKAKDHIAKNFTWDKVGIFIQENLPEKVAAANRIEL